MGGSLGGRLPECFYHVYSKRRVTRLRLSRIVANIVRSPRSGLTNLQSEQVVRTSANFRIT